MTRDREMEGILGFRPEPGLLEVQTRAAGPAGSLPLTAEMLLHAPSGDVFGLSQNAGMGWDPAEVGRKPFLILSTQGGIRSADGRPGNSRAGLAPPRDSPRPQGRQAASATCGTIPQSRAAVARAAHRSNRVRA